MICCDACYTTLRITLYNCAQCNATNLEEGEDRDYDTCVLMWTFKLCGESLLRDDSWRVDMPSGDELICRLRVHGKWTRSSCVSVSIKGILLVGLRSVIKGIVPIVHCGFIINLHIIHTNLHNTIDTIDKLECVLQVQKLGSHTGNDKSWSSFTTVSSCPLNE